MVGACESAWLARATVVGGLAGEAVCIYDTYPVASISIRGQRPSRIYSFEQLSVRVAKCLARLQPSLPRTSGSVCDTTKAWIQNILIPYATRREQAGGVFKQFCAPRFRRLKSMFYPLQFLLSRHTSAAKSATDIGYEWSHYFFDIKHVSHHEDSTEKM